MKKLLKIFSLCFVFSVMFAGISSANDCINRNLGSNSICVSIDKGNSNKYTLNSDVKCRGNCLVSCSILLPNNRLYTVGACNGTFEYSSSSSEKLKLYITIDSKFNIIEGYYNFRDGTWGNISSDDDDDDDYYYDDDDDYYYDDDDDYYYYDDDNYYDYDDYYNYNRNYSEEMNRAYQYAYRYGITTQKSIETAGMNQRLTRIAMAKMLSMYAINVLGKTPSRVSTPSFSDVSYSLDRQYDNGVTLAYQLGIMGINMPNNKFRPYDTVTRAEFATALSRLLFKLRDGSDVYYSTHLRKLYDEGIITNTNPKLQELRGYVMIMLMRSADVDSTDYYYDNELEISTNNKNPSTSEYVNLTMRTDRDYAGNISFYKVQYKSTNSSSWSTISRTDSTYFSNNSSDEWENGYYKMKYSDYGQKTISKFIKFNKKGYYRIYAKDKDGNNDYIDFNVGNPSSYNYDLEISTNDRYPSISEYVGLIIETDADYEGKIYLSAKYKSSSSSSWSDISNNNSTYFSNRSNAWSNGYTSISSNGYKRLSDVFKFAKKGYYRIYVKDEDGNTDYVDFNVGGSSISNNELQISASSTSPTVGNYINLTIDTYDDYRGNVTFYKVQYRSSSSNTRSNITRTSSTYFSNYSDEWENGYYRMTSADNGHKVISNFLKFAKSGYYRIYAKDIDGKEDYIDFHVYASSYYNDNIELDTNDIRPDAGEYIDLTVRTDNSYRGEIYLSAKYRESSSSSRSNINRTSSTYFTDRSTTWTNGYLNISSSDIGEKTVENIFKFAKKGYYEIIAEDEYGNSTYLDFNVGDPVTSPLAGFTQKEFEMIERMYNTWPTLINKLKSEYPRLRNNTAWKNLSDELYENMGDVVNKRSNRVFKDYDDFDTAFRYWFSRTQDLIG